MTIFDRCHIYPNYSIGTIKYKDHIRHTCYVIRKHQAFQRNKILKKSIKY